MGKIKKLFAFIINQNGEEKIMALPVNSEGTERPLLYLDENIIKDTGMREIIQKYANQYNLYIELREYQIVTSSVEKFYPPQINYNA